VTNISIFVDFFRVPASFFGVNFVATAAHVIAGWKGINESDMILMPDPSTAKIDPFFDDNTLILRCDIIEPSDMQGYERDPRSIPHDDELR
jgi:glutamine synthetase